MRKRFISLLLCCAMVFGLCVPASAKGTPNSVEGLTESILQTVPTTHIEDTGNGYLWTSADNEKAIAIITYEDRGLIDISIKYYDQPNIVYQWTELSCPDSTYSITEDILWPEIVAYAESMRNMATVVEITEEKIDETMVPFSTNVTIREDLMAALESREGKGYTNKLLHQETYRGLGFKIYEDKSLSVNYYRISWDKPMSVSSFILTIVGGLAKNPEIVRICSIFGVVISAASLIPAGSADKYLCQAQYCRFVKVNGESRVYSAVYKNSDYVAVYGRKLDDDINAHIINDESYDQYYDYTHEKLFNSYTELIYDAYIEYMS